MLCQGQIHDAHGKVRKRSANFEDLYMCVSSWVSASDVASSRIKEPLSCSHNALLWWTLQEV